jgi:hypothetical protein
VTQNSVRGVVVPIPGKKFRKAIPVSILLRKNFWNGILAHSVIKKIPHGYTAVKNE